MNRSMLSIAVLAVCGAADSAIAGPEWIETGDAGSSLATSQVISAGGPILSLRGTLLGTSAVAGGPDFEDIYQIFIDSPATFVMDHSDSLIDFSFFLFDENGFALLGNLDSPFGLFGGPAIGNESTDGTSIVLNTPGIYYFAISGNGNVPLSLGGQMFDFLNPFEVSGPDGIGGLGPLAGWSGAGVTGEYDIQIIHGVVPAPPVAVAGLLSVLLAGRRRRAQPASLIPGPFQRS